MDRLLCGDVATAKQVALRAAFKAIVEKTGAARPTTIPSSTIICA